MAANKKFKAWATHEIKVSNHKVSLDKKWDEHTWRSNHILVNYKEMKLYDEMKLNEIKLNEMMIYLIS